MGRLKKFFDKIKIQNYVSGKNKTLDLLLTRFILHIPMASYLNYRLDKVPWKLRKYYLYDPYIYAKIYNPGVTELNHDDKKDLTLKLKKYLYRDVLFTEELNLSDLNNIFKSKKELFYKPYDGDGGSGILKIKVGDYLTVEDLYRKIKSLPAGLLEDKIVQHKDLNKLCPNVVQTIRFTVFKLNKKTIIAFSSIRTTGNRDAYVDNASSGGLFANIDINTGKIITNAFCILSDVKDIKKIDPDLLSSKGLYKHPITGVVFKGFEIPYFQDAKEMVLNVTQEINFYDRKFLGFDVAITDKGPVIVEVNTTRPGFNLWQGNYRDIPLRKVLDKMLIENN